MKRENEFKLYLKQHNITRDYVSNCKTIEKAFGGKDMDIIISSHQNISKVRTKLQALRLDENTIDSYLPGLNHYLKFSVAAKPYFNVARYNVSRAKDVPLTSEVDFVCRTLENEYANIIQFAKDLLSPGSFESIPIIVSDEMPMQEGPEKIEKVLGRFFGSDKPYIEIYYRNFNPHDAAAIRNCLAHEYMHYLHYVFAGKEYENADKDLKEGLADFFGFLYSIHRHGKDDLSTAKKRYNSWKKYFNTFWPYAKALYFFQVGGKEMKYSSSYNNFVNYGSIKKFVNVFFSTQHSDDAYKAMLCC